jgi:hypothetical protein
MIADALERQILQQVGRNVAYLVQEQRAAGERTYLTRSNSALPR